MIQLLDNFQPQDRHAAQTDSNMLRSTDYYSLRRKRFPSKRLLWFTLGMFACDNASYACSHGDNYGDGIPSFCFISLIILSLSLHPIRAWIDSSISFDI